MKEEGDTREEKVEGGKDSGKIKEGRWEGRRSKSDGEIRKGPAQPVYWPQGKICMRVQYSETPFYQHYLWALGR